MLIPEDTRLNTAGPGLPPPEWFATQGPFPSDLRIHDLIADAARRYPDRPALLDADGVVYTHGELDQAAKGTALRLRELGLAPGGYVALLSDHHPEAVRGLIGVLRTGAAYVPLDPRWPLRRLGQILTQVAVTCLLTDRDWLPTATRLAELVPGLRHVLVLDEQPADVPGPVEPAGSSSPDTGYGEPDDVAYCIFTSGSTGRPKGVLVQHRPVVNVIDWVNREFSVQPTDRMLFVTSFAFDLSVYDMFGVLAAGGSVRVVPDADLADPDVLLDIMVDEQITFWDSAPAVMAYLLSATAGRRPPARPALRRVFLGGDWIPLTMPGRIRRFFPGAQVVSTGGATEATVWANFFPIGEVDPGWPSIPYGRPMRNAQYHVLDAKLDPCPIGTVGDLYIAGDCLSLGYAGDPALTAWKYLPNPYGAGRMYRTGDRGRWLATGDLEFLGRLDHQVKVRGYRIELGEVESAMARCDGVLEAVVVAKPVDGDKELVGYYRCHDGTVGEAGLREHLRLVLPGYMMPARLVRLARFPMTASGKTDRRALADRTADQR